MAKCFERGVWAPKLTIAGSTGWPDRGLLFPGGRIVFMEAKREGEKPRRKQEYIHTQLRALGFEVWVFDNCEDALVAVDEVLHG